VGSDIPIVREAGFEYMLEDFYGKKLHRADAGSVFEYTSLHIATLLLLKENALVYCLDLSP
jgi:hypothetical protein